MTSIPFNNRYVNLGEAFYVRTHPETVAAPALIKFNDELASSLGLSVANVEDCASIFSGNVIPEGAEPLAMAYAGHQFGGFNPQLGDGRAILLGELVHPSGASVSVHLKGSGQTHFSRNGDGRAALGPVLREYLLSEAMHKLGVPTTRALAAVTTGEQVARERMLPGGVITRVAKSFVRIGTFEYFAARDNYDAVKQLADYVIEHNYPQLREVENPYQALLQAVVDAQAKLIAQWMQLGFIHGVMNTDNMSIAGETIDYGPCAFIDAFDYNKVFSSIDQNGRYAYGNQPSIGMWNLTRFAETLLPLLAKDSDAAIEIAKNILETYIETYQRAWLDGMRAKCGLLAVSDKTAHKDKVLIDDLLDTMAAGRADFTLTFFYLSRLSAQPSEADEDIRKLFARPAQFNQWFIKWRERLNNESLNDEQRQVKMQAVNPVYIPRNHQVEAAIRAAEDHGDFSVFRDLHEVLQNPYEVQKGRNHYMSPPKPHEVVSKTFCGT
ncbi:MAG: YdiU family protein [Gammaproteobacteria bacterium]|nr:YdiU family protein [Gammaproteobacteria bacterium]MCW8923847.1 YdiU family protein [Gammaproteobacteria bacterium]